jgi:hypothetical protein
VTVELAEYPAWARELYARLPVTPQLVLAGNVTDDHLAPHPRRPDILVPRHTVDVIAECLRHSGYTVVLKWNAVAGLAPAYEAEPGLAASLVDAHQGPDETSVASVVSIMTAVVEHTRARVALVLDGVPRLAPEQADLHRIYVTAAHLSRDPNRRQLSTDIRDGLTNAVVWTVQQENDLPHWLLGASGVHVISVPMPTMQTRTDAARFLVPSLPGYDRLGDDARAKVVTDLAEHTEGMPLKRMAAAIPTALDRDIDATRIVDAVRFLRTGMQGSPWREPVVRERIRAATATLNSSVLGQERAVRKVVDVLARSVLGLTGAQSSGHPTRPQGVLFLAGPTGVGKTELAKQLAATVFGRQEAMIRFDMSEFAAEHTEARLLGAPPGYVGHDAGGELTNAVRREPFSLLLFDEIDKANTAILDKFLQILEDGRLTDGSGSTVHFTETLIIFTSNLGIYEERDGVQVPVVLPGTGYGEVERRVLAAIKAAFLRIKRPELLNRIGDNVIVFDFISAETARRLLRRNLAHVLHRVEENAGQRVLFEPAAVKQLEELVVAPERLAFGGRAVGSLLESRVINPLARELLTAQGRSRFVVSQTYEDDEGVRLRLRD